MAGAHYQLSQFSIAQNKWHIPQAVHCIVRDYYKPRFDTEQVSDIKSALDLFREDRQSHCFGSAAHGRAHAAHPCHGRADSDWRAQESEEEVGGGQTHLPQESQRRASVRRWPHEPWKTGSLPRQLRKGNDEVRKEIMSEMLCRLKTEKDFDNKG